MHIYYVYICIYMCNLQHILREVNAPVGMCMRRRHTTKTPATKRIKHKTETCLRLIAVMKFINLSTRQRVAPVLLRYCTARPSYGCLNFCEFDDIKLPNAPMTAKRVQNDLDLRQRLYARRAFAEPDS